MPVIEGRIKAVSRKTRPTKYGDKEATSFNIDDQWYSGGFKDWGVGKGDVVQINVDDSPYKNIKTLMVKEHASSVAEGPKSEKTGGGFGGSKMAGRTFPVDPLAPERTINRQNALTNAVNYFGISEHEPTPETVIAVARMFEAYTTGDLDRDEAMAMLDDN